MNRITVPQLGVNDLFATLSKRIASDYSLVSVGDILCELETSKAVVEFVSEYTGTMIWIVQEGENVQNSQVIALIGEEIGVLEKERDRILTSSPPPFQATEKAKLLAEKLGIHLEKVISDGVIRERDVLDYHKRKEGGHIFSPHQLDLPLYKIPVAIYGAGKGGSTVWRTLLSDEEYQPVCFIDDFPRENTLNQLPVFHSSVLPQLDERICLFVAIANGHKRLDIIQSSTRQTINAIHRLAYVEKGVSIGVGNHIKASAMVDASSVIGDACIVDNGVIIPHDNRIGNGVHLAPGVVLGSSVEIGDFSIVGIGASIASGTKIGKNVIVSVGSSVTRDIPDNGIVEGVPGKIIGETKL